MLPVPLPCFTFLHCTYQLRTHYIYYLFSTCLYCSVSFLRARICVCYVHWYMLRRLLWIPTTWWDWVSTVLKLILVLRSTLLERFCTRMCMCTHTHTSFLLKTARGVWLLELTSWLGSEVCVLFPELPLMICVHQLAILIASNLLSVEGSVRLVKFLRGKSVLLCASQLLGKRARSVCSSCDREGCPCTLSAPVWG